MQFILIASGGAVGALSRYLVSIFSKSYVHDSFYGTLFINILGSFFIGFLISVGVSKNMSADFIKYFLIIGFLGSFTTFSTFSMEVIELYMSSKFLLAFFYIFLTIFFCIFASFIGFSINKIWLKHLK